MVVYGQVVGFGWYGTPMLDIARIYRLNAEYKIVFYDCSCQHR